MTRTKDKLTKGVYRDKSGIAIRISVRGKPREFRKNEHGRAYKYFTPAQLRDERKRLIARELLIADRAAAKADTLQADVTRYLDTLTERSRQDAANLLKHWTQHFGDRPRRAITALELRTHAATWTCAASTYNHRRQALITLYRALDGPTAPNPVRELPKRKEIAGAPKALSYDVIRAALKAMPDTQSRARLALMAYTGLPQMQIAKLTPDDWHGARLRVTPRRKGAGAAGRWIPLSPEAQAAMKDFARLACWGTFSRSSLCKAWKAFGPKGTNPYSLRHSWITELYRRSNGDVLAVKHLALHSMLAQTERYAAAALDERATALVLPRSFPMNEVEDRQKHSKTIHENTRRASEGKSTKRARSQKRNAK
jgi:integrase